MAGALVSTVSSLLKDVYLAPVIEQLNNEVLLISRVERISDAEMVGNQVVIPLHKGRSGAIGSRTEEGALPAAGNQVFARAVYDLTQHYGRGQVSGLSMAKTKSNVGAFLDVLKLEMDGIRNDLKKDIARQVYGCSDGSTTVNSRIAKMGVTTASATLVLDSDEPLRKGHLYVGMRVDVGTLAAPTSLINGEAITAVSIANKTITVTTAVTTDATHFVGRAGNPSASSAGKEINGLQSIVSTAASSIGGIDAAAAGNEYWDNQRDTSGGALVIDKMIKLDNAIRVAGGNVTALYTSFGVRREYFKLLQPLVQYTEPLNLKGGFQSLSFSGGNGGSQPLIPDVDARFGVIFFLDEKHIKHFANEDWHFLQEDGDVLKWVTGFDAWEFALAKYFQIGVDRRNVLGIMSGLTDATGV